MLELRKFAVYCVVITSFFLFGCAEMPIHELHTGYPWEVKHSIVVLPLVPQVEGARTGGGERIASEISKALEKLESFEIYDVKGTLKKYIKEEKVGEEITGEEAKTIGEKAGVELVVWGVVTDFQTVKETDKETIREQVWVSADVNNDGRTTPDEGYYKEVWRSVPVAKDVALVSARINLLDVKRGQIVFTSSHAYRSSTFLDAASGLAEVLVSPLANVIRERKRGSYRK